MAQRDYARPGEYYSADYLRISGLDASESFSSMFGLRRCAQKSANNADVISADKVWPKSCPVDDSPVYVVFSKNPEVFFRHFEFSNSQNAVQLAAPAPAGTQMIVTYAAIRTSANSGVAYFHNAGNTIVFGKIYISSKSDFAASDLYVPMGDGDAIFLTCSQGTAPLFACFNVKFEQIRIIE